MGIKQGISAFGVQNPPSPFPTRQYLVALNNGPLDDPAAITSIASPPGTVGGHNVWTDLTNVVELCDIVRGRQHELSRFEAGTCALTVSNVGGKFNTWDASGPYYNLLKPMKLLQVRAKVGAQTFYRFTGHVTAIKPIWDDPVGQQKATIEAKDAFHFFNQGNLPSGAYLTHVALDGPTHQWRCNDAPGATVLADSVGIAGGVLHAGTNVGIPVMSTDTPLLAQSNCGSVKFGSYDASGSPASNWIDLSTGAMTGTVWSVELWFKVTGASGQTTLISQGAGTTDLLYVGLANGAVFMNVTDGAGVTTNTTNSTFNVYDGQWYYVVASYDGSSTSLTVGNGSNSSFSFGFPTGVTTLHPGQTVRLGASGSGAAQGGIQVAEVATFVGNANVGGSLGADSVAIMAGRTGNQIGQVLNLVGWPAGARNIDSGVQICPDNSQNVLATSALARLQAEEVTEGGALFMQGDGKVRFVSRDNIAVGTTSGQVQAWFGDDVQNPATVAKWDAGKWGQQTWGTLSIPYQPGPDIGLDELDIVNQSIVTRVGGQAQIANDPVSQDPVNGYGLRSQSIGNVLHQSDGASQAHAQWIVNKLSQPVFRMRTLSVNLVDILYDPSKVTRLLGLELMQRVKVNRYQVGFEQIALIERWEEKMTADTWDITVALSPTDTYQNWQWNGAQ